MSKFIHNTFAIVKTAHFGIEQCKKLLQSRGYNMNILSCEGDYIFTYGDKFYIGTEEFCKVFEKSKKAIDKDFKGFIDCGEDIALFMMLISIRSDRIDQWQVFMSKDNKNMDVCSTVRNNSPDMHKATAKEILQKFAPSKIPDYMKEE